jgi:hypothetical protein
MHRLPPSFHAPAIANPSGSRQCRWLILPLWLAAAMIWVQSSGAQGPMIALGTGVSSETRAVYERGLKYLATTQLADGTWSGGQNGPGVTGLCLMAFLAHGDDPNYGPYAVPIRRAVQSILSRQDKGTGYYGDSMYHHGFATLALAEAYGAVDESLLADGNGPQGEQSKRTIANSLELAVRCAITSQKRNSLGGWRYSPDSVDADTSVSGAVLMGLLAARNAGMEVPDEAIDKALKYYRASTSDTGMVAYSNETGGAGTSMNRASIATLVYAVGKHKDWKEFDATLEHIVSRKDDPYQEGYPSYFRYYMSQALFQGNPEAWDDWKNKNLQAIAELQQADGSIPDDYGPACGTALHLLSLALEFRYLPIYER